MSKEGTTTIYALASPFDGRIFYVGASEKPKRRYYQHLASANRPDRTPMRDWLLGLIEQDEQPVMIFLAEVPHDQRNAEERLWTSVLKRRGEPLFNRENLYIYAYTGAERQRCRISRAPRWQPVRGRGRKRNA